MTNLVLIIFAANTLVIDEHLIGVNYVPVSENAGIITYGGPPLSEEKMELTMKIAKWKYSQSRPESESFSTGTTGSVRFEGVIGPLRIEVFPEIKIRMIWAERQTRPDNADAINRIRELQLRMQREKCSSGGDQ